MTDVNKFVDLREQFRLKKKPRSLQSKTPLVIDDSNTVEVQTRLARSRSIPGYECQVHNAVMLDDIEALRIILEIGNVQLNVLGPHGITPLHRACTGGSLEIVKLLIESGADVSLLTKDGHTALNIAATNGHFELSEYLLQKGAKAEEIKDGVKVD